MRQDVLTKVRYEYIGFLDGVIEGAFTVPGEPEGCIYFPEVTKALAAMDYDGWIVVMDYDGWIVVKAEQDPAKAPPYDYSRTGYDNILTMCHEAGLDVVT